MNKTRLTNIELLRILSMIMILFLHIFNHGGLLNSVETFSLNYYIVWLLEALCFVAVNCYILISGYFLIDSKFNFNMIIKLWFEVFFYSVFITFLVAYFYKIDTFDIIKSFIPIITTSYWFVTVYIGMLLISPFLNVLIHSMNKKYYKLLLITNLILFSVIPILPIQSGLLFGSGYGIVWFINLYLIAGYIKIYSIKFKRYKCISLYLLMCLITFFLKHLLDFVNFNYFGTDFLYYYNCLPIVIASVGLFLFFLQIKINNNIINRIILFFAPLTLGVYLIHEHPLFRDILWKKINIVSDIDSPYLVIKVVVIVFSLYIVFSLFDFIRTIIFRKFKPNFNEIVKKINNKYEIDN